MQSVDTARHAQAQACLSKGPCLTVVFLTFSVLVQAGGGGYEHRDLFNPKIVLAASTRR